MDKNCKSWAEATYFWGSPYNGCPTVVYRFGKSYSPEHDKRWGTLDIPRIPIPILHFTPDAIHPGHGMIPLTGNPSECNFPIVTTQFGRKA